MNQLILVYLLAVLGCGQQLASQLFASDQIVLWNGNTAAQYQQAPTPYQFSNHLLNPPPNVNKMLAIFNGLSMNNQYRISFTVDVSMNVTVNGAYRISFNPIATISFYSASFSIIAISASSLGLLGLDRFVINPSIISNSTRAAGADQETFVLNSPLTFTNSSFQVINFISYLDSLSSTGPSGVTLSSNSAYSVGTNQFSVVVDVPPNSILFNCTIISLILNKYTILVSHSVYIKSNQQVSLNLAGYSDTSLSTYTSANFSIPSFYGPMMSRNCTIGFNGIYANSDSTTKTMIFSYDTSSTGMSYSESAGGGIMAYYLLICMVDCNSDSFYYSPLSKCDYCSKYIKYCQACTSATTCTDCGANTFFDSIHQVCSCQFGSRVENGCTTTMACASVADNGTCNRCLTGYNLQSNGLCACSSGYNLVTNVCTNIYGCVTAAIVKNVTRCFSCNSSLHLQTDGNGGCDCISGYSLYNGVCTTLCGNGELFGLEECDDGNHVSGDGCSSLCQVQKSYQCATSESYQSVCTYKTEFAYIDLIESYRDIQQNAGFFIFKLTPAIQNLNKMNFKQYITISLDNKSYEPIVTYGNGILKIKIEFSQDIQKKTMNVTLKFNQTIIIHKPISTVFDIKSMNSPMVIFNKFPQYNFIKIYLQVLSVLAIVIFLLGSWVHKMIGVQTIHIFQCIFFTCIYEVSFQQLFITAIQNLRFTSNYSDLFYDQQSNVREGGIFQSLMFSFTFVDNYFIIGTLQIITIIIFIGLFLHNSFKNQQRQLNNEVNQQNCKLMEYQKRKEYVYSISFFPLVVGYCIQCFFAVEAQLYRKDEMINRFQTLINSFLSIIFTYMTSVTMFKQIFFNFQQTAKSTIFNVQNRYIAIYLVNVLIIIIFFNFSDRFQYDLTSFASYNFLYFLIVFIYRPYKEHIHNFHILLNQLLFVAWMVFLIYQDRAEQKLSDDQKYIVLMALVSFLSLSLLIAVVRIIVQVVTNGNQKVKINKFYQGQLTKRERQRSKRKVRLQAVKEEVKRQPRYRLQEQRQEMAQRERQLVNLERKALGMNKLFARKNTEGQYQRKRQGTMITRPQFANKQSEKTKAAKEQQLQAIKLRLRQNLLRFKRQRQQIYQ